MSRAPKSPELRAAEKLVERRRADVVAAARTHARDASRRNREDLVEAVRDLDAAELTERQVRARPVAAVDAITEPAR